MAKTIQNIRETNIIPKSCREHFLAVTHPAAAPLRELGIHMSGISDLHGAYEMGRPRASFHLMLYTIAGAGQLKTPDGMRVLKPGELLIAPALSTYQYKIHREPWRIAWFHFEIDKAFSAWDGHAFEVRRSSLGTKVERAMEGFIAETFGATPATLPTARLYGDLIALHIRREWERTDNPVLREAQARVAHVWELVRADLRRPWNVEALAQEAHCSSGHFFRLSQMTFGLSPMEMVTRLRMERARDLLCGTAYPAKQIAEWCGYSNPFAFSTAFKRQWGVSPRQARQAARK